MRTYKKLFLLLFFMLPTATQCMKRHHSKISNSAVSTITSRISTLEKERKKVISYVEDNLCAHRKLLLYKGQLQFIINGDCKAFLPAYRSTRIEGYSYLGFVAMSTIRELSFNRYVYKNLPYKEKEFFINHLLKLNFKPTLNDKKVAFIEKYERLQPKANVFYCAHKNNMHWLSYIPSDIIKQMLLCMFKTEKPLF